MSVGIGPGMLAGQVLSGKCLAGACRKSCDTLFARSLLGRWGGFLLGLAAIGGWGLGLSLAGAETPQDGTLQNGVTSRFAAVECGGSYRHHLQGVCADADAIYWSFTTTLVKTDLAGKVLREIPVANHHGDLCQVDGKLYVAVNLGKFNRPAGEADSWVYVYDADSLDELARHEVPELVHGAGGMGFHDGKFIVVGGLPDGTPENYLYEYDESFRFRRRHVLDSGWTRLGIQTAAYHDGQWWFGCYGNDLLVTDAEFRLVGQYKYDCGLGIEGLPDGRMLSAGGKCEGDAGCRGWVKLVTPQELHLAPKK